MHIEFRMIPFIEILACKTNPAVEQRIIIHFRYPLIIDKKGMAAIVGKDYQAVFFARNQGRLRPVYEGHGIAVENQVEPEKSLIGDKEVIEILVVYIMKDKAQGRIGIGGSETHFRFHEEIAVFIEGIYDPGKEAAFLQVQAEVSITPGRLVIPLVFDREPAFG